MTNLHNISPEDWASLRKAVYALEHPSLAARLTSVLGTPIEEGIKLLPTSWYQRLRRSTESAMQRTLDVAISTMPSDRPIPDDNQHRIMGMASGAVGGLFGLPGLLLELPVTTMFMLRSIAAIAAREGEDLETLDARLSCVEVFALGGPATSDDAAETGYYGLRAMLAYHFSTVSQAAAERGLANMQLPAVVNLVRAVAARFGIVISEKAAYQALPLFGAAGGALINAIFMDHFQKMAHGHFIVRRLERSYGSEPVRAAYESVATLHEEASRGVVKPVSEAPPIEVSRGPAVRTIHKTARVNASREQVFELVSGIGDYPRFIDHCDEVSIKEDADGVLSADISLKWHGLNGRFPIAMQHDRPRRVNALFTTDLFHHLETDWSFTDEGAESGCTINLTIYYEFESRMKQMLFGGAVDNIASQLIEAVAGEAEKVSRSSTRAS